MTRWLCSWICFLHLDTSPAKAAEYAWEIVDWTRAGANRVLVPLGLLTLGIGATWQTAHHTSLAGQGNMTGIVGHEVV